MSIDPDFLVPGGALQGPLFARLCEDATPSPAPVLPVGTAIGRYRIETLIGHGGSGSVYRASRNDGAFEQDVALKIVRPHPRLRERFRRERNILGQLGHPGIARIFDGGETDDGDLWCAMELVEGERIDRWCERRGAGWRRRVELMIAVCDAVQYAHTHLIVHRDIKPSNVLVDDNGLPRLLDFGISSSIGAQDEAGALAFTPAFASPEQLAGETVTAASDVYQLGRLLGVLFEGGTSRMPALASANLATVVGRATETEAQARYATVSDLRADLVRVLAGDASRAVPWRWWWRGRFFARRNALVLSLATLSAAVLVAATLHYTARIRVERDRAEAQARQASTTAEVLANLFRTAAATFDGEESERTLALLDRAAANTLRRLADAPAQRAVAAEALAQAYVDIGRREQARAFASATLAELDRRAPALAAERAALHRLLVRLDLDAGDPASARAHYEQARRLQQAYAPDADERAALAAAHVALLQQGGAADEAGRERGQLIAAMERDGLAGTPLFAELLSARARESYNRNDLDAARADFERAHALMSARYGPASPQALDLERLRIWISLRRGEGDDADARLARQRAAVLESFGERSREYGGVLTFEGVVAWERGDFERAGERFGSAYAVLVDVLGADHVTVANAAHNYADALLDRGEPARALPLYERALDIRRRRYGEDYQPILVNRVQIARALCELDRFEAAEAEFAPVRERLAGILAESHPSLLSAAAHHAECRLRQGRVAEARALFDRAVPERHLAAVTGGNRLRLEATAKAIAQAEAAAPR